MNKSFWGTLVGWGIGLAACSTTPAGHDAGAFRDTAPAGYDAAGSDMDAAVAPVGTIYIRLVNLVPASPNLTVCLAAIPGAGIAPVTAHILGQPDPPTSDGTLPFPGVSPYLPALIYDAPGFGYELRLYDRAQLPFSALGVCPDAEASPAPIVTARFAASDLMIDHHYSLAIIGVLPGTPVTCPGACPPVQTRLFEDTLSRPPSNRVRVRLFQGVPNLPAPIHVCFDFDYSVVGGVVMDGPVPPSRVLPPASDTDGLAFGEVTPYIEIPPVTSAGAFYTHATVSGVPDCDTSTRLLGPITVPLPIPASAPVDVARIFIGGDVITNFAFGRAGSMCTTASDCVAPSSICVGAACTCDATHHCVDDISGNLLPWRDVRGDFHPDAGTLPDAGM